MLYRVVAKPSDTLLKQRYGLTQEQVELCKEVHGGDFLEWVCKNYSNKWISLPEQKEELSSLLDLFDKLRKKKNYPGSKDINRYTYKDLLNIKNIEVPEGNKKKKVLQDTLTYSWEHWKLYVPRNIQEFMFLSGGSSISPKGDLYPETSWCTTNLENAESYFEREKNLIIKKDDRNYAQIDMAFFDIKDCNDEDMVVRNYLLDPELGAFLKRLPYKFWFRTGEIKLTKLKNLVSSEFRTLCKFYAAPNSELETILEDRLRKRGILAVNDLISYEDTCGSWALAKRILLETAEPPCLSHYAVFGLKSRWPEAEPIIFTSSEATVDYCDAFHFRAPEEVENKVILNPNNTDSYYDIRNYLREVVRGPWPAFLKLFKGDPSMMKLYREIA